MKVGSSRTLRSYAKLGLLSVMALSLLTTGTVFLRVNATDAAVSSSDTVVTFSDTVKVDDGNFLSPKKEESGKEEVKPEEKEIRYLGRVIKLPEIITAKGVCEVSAPRKRFKPSAAYETCYGDELCEAERILYNGYVSHFITNDANGSFTVSYLVDEAPVVRFALPENDDDDIVEIRDIVLCATAAFTYDYPEAYWVRAISYSIGYCPDDDDTGYLAKLNITPSSVYANDYAQRGTVKSGLNSAVAAIKKSRSSEQRYDTVKAIHDYICNNASYDYDAVSGDFYTYGAAYTGAPLFGGGTRGKKFVCEGYAKAMKMLCKRFDIPCALVSGNVGSQSEPHMWNYVQMEDGNWYAVDATWDDQIKKIVYNYFLVGSDTKVSKDEILSQNHVSSGYVMTTRTQDPMAYPSLSSDKYLDPAKISIKTLGASIRLSQPYGIRFGIQIKKDAQWKNAKIQEYGTLIIGSGTLGDNELTLDTEKVLRIKGQNLYSEDSGQFTYTGVLTNIPDSFFDTKVKGCGYLIYKDEEGKDQVIYSKTEEKTFNGVVRAAYDSYSKIENPNAAQERTLSLLRELLGES